MFISCFHEMCEAVFWKSRLICWMMSLITGFRVNVHLVSIRQNLHIADKTMKRQHSYLKFYGISYGNLPSQHPIFPFPNDASCNPCTNYHESSRHPFRLPMSYNEHETWAYCLSNCDRQKLYET